MNNIDTEINKYTLQYEQRPKLNENAVGKNDCYLMEKYFFYQYAEGIGGQQHISSIFVAKKRNILTKIRNFLEKPYSIKGEPTIYGNIGAQSLTYHIFKASNFEKEVSLYANRYGSKWYDAEKILAAIS